MDHALHLHLDINLTYVTIFTFLGMFISFMHIPKESTKRQATAS